MCSLVPRVPHIPEVNQELNDLLWSFGLLDPITDGVGLSGLEVRRIAEHSPIGEMITDYFDRSYICQPNTTVRPQIVHMWSVKDIDRYERFIENGFERIDNYLLFHGTKRRFLSSILKKGLINPSPGRGIFFADRSSKSIGYTDGTGAMVVLLNEVALGNMYKYKGQTEQMSQTIHDSHKILGTNVPDSSEDKIVGNWLLPCGQTVVKLSDGNRYSNRYNNEYIIQDADRVRTAFVLNCQWPNQQAQ